MAADHGLTAGGRVSWDPALYGANNAHHRRHDDDFLASLPLPAAARVLDLGCGVGDFTVRLASAVPEGEVIGVDAAAALIAAARRERVDAAVRFAVCRAQDVSATFPPDHFDVVVSRAVLHWITAEEQESVLAGVWQVLQPGGRFRAEFGGRGQLGDLVSLLDEESDRVGGPVRPWYFPTAEEYRGLLTAAGFRIGSSGWVRLVRQRRSFPDQSALTGFLVSQVLVAYEIAMTADQLREFRGRATGRAIRELRRADGSFDLDFVRLDLMAIRPNAENA